MAIQIEILAGIMAIITMNITVQIMITIISNYQDSLNMNITNYVI
jgi:hypothetical protein